MNRPKNLCKSAIVAFVWVCLTTPLTTLPLLHLADDSAPIQRWVATLPQGAMIAILGGIIIGLPVIGTILAAFAMGRVKASWTPMAGSGFAKGALFLGILSTIAGAIMFGLGLSGT